MSLTYKRNRNTDKNLKARNQRKNELGSDSQIEVADKNAKKRNQYS